MILILTLNNPEALKEGMAAQLIIDGAGATIGRSKNCDWHLPDPQNAISSRHCQIARDRDGFTLTDISTNGTYLNGANERMSAPHRLAAGDVFRVGDYEIGAAFEEEVMPAPEATIPPPPSAPAPPPPADNVTVMWDQVADVNRVDWARGGFGVADAATVPVTAVDGATADALVAALLDAAGLAGAEVERSPELVQKAGALIKRLVSGLLVLVEARARAKAQMGAETTQLQLDGNNPLKFALSPEQALAQLLGPPAPGFLAADKAVEDAYLDLQSHQVATLKAIPGALRATLDRFSPGSIRRRAENIGLIARILPGARDAALWRNYEREFVAVKKESDEAFMEVFAKEFRKAYARQLDDGLS
jgi:predicted component of type VI protein secretion system